MSFGFEKPSKDMKRAITDHYDKKILFAAAANHGGNDKRIAFPAKLERVICVKASDGFGDPAPFSPWNDEDAGFNFMTLGREVISMWRLHEPDGMQISQNRCSGTSVATPIAAAIAGLALEFLRQPDEPNEPKYLTLSLEEFESDPRNNIKKVFLQMCDERTGHKNGVLRYVYPWELLTSQKDGELRSRRLEAATAIHRILCVS
jgi:hypothetical protein